MVNHIIYKDNDKEISIKGEIHQLINHLQKVEFTLDDEEMDIVQQMAVNLLIKADLNFKPIVVIKNIPIVKYNAPIHLRPPHQYFNDVFEYLSDYYSLDDDYKEIMEEINNKFKDQNIYCFLFPHRVFDIKGFLIKIEEKQTYLLFFDYKDYNGNLFDLF